MRTVVTFLPAITGAWRDAGGGVQLSTSYAFHLNRTALEMPQQQWKSTLGHESRLVNMVQLGAALTTLNDPPVKALVVYGTPTPPPLRQIKTPSATSLRRDDLFTVVL